MTREEWCRPFQEYREMGLNVIGFECPKRHWWNDVTAEEWELTAFLVVMAVYTIGQWWR